MTDDALRHASADALHVRAEVPEDLGADTLALASQPEQKVLGPDVALLKLQGLPERQLEDLPGPRREREVTRLRGLASSDDLLDLLNGNPKRDVQRLKRFGSDASLFAEKGEQDVLGPDVVVIEHPRLFLGKDHDPSRLVGESLEQQTPLRSDASSQSRPEHLPGTVLA